MNLLKLLKQLIKTARLSQASPEVQPPEPPVASHPQLPDRHTFKDVYFAEQPLDLQSRETFQAHELPLSGPQPWLDQPDALIQIQQRLQQGEITPAEAKLCQQFVEEGYVILEGILDAATIDSVWAAYEAAIAAGELHPSPEKKTVDDPHPGHVMNAHLAVPEIYQLFADRQLLHLIELLLGREPIPFQTLMFPKGREQLAHSDSIHMTTYPLGYLCAAWIACEDIQPNSGALLYYPGSHRLPYIFSQEVGLSPQEFATQLYSAVAEKYEPYIQQVIRDHQLQPQLFYPRKGDVLIWHANLLHGGSPRTDLRPTRKSLVCHYFAKGAFCYHDLSGRPAERVF